MVNSNLDTIFPLSYKNDIYSIYHIEKKPKGISRKILEVITDSARGSGNIDNCELKSNSTKLVFSDGNYQSQIMIRFCPIMQMVIFFINGRTK